MGFNVLIVLVFSQIVKFSLSVFLLLPLEFKGFKVVIVSLTASSDLVSKFRMLVCNFDLFLKPCFFIFELSESVFHHLSLDSQT